jgi:hypothetical protein
MRDGPSIAMCRNELDINRAGGKTRIGQAFFFVDPRYPKLRIPENTLIPLR